MMDFVNYAWIKLSEFLPALITVAGVIFCLAFVNWFLLHRKSDMGEELRFTRRILVFLLSSIGVIIILLVLPVNTAIRGHLLSLFGLLLSAVIALSSTTFVSNVMAGLMLRAVYSFRPGDFVYVDEQFGRVTERGLIHTEIQTEDRDLVTIPNLYLITNPVRFTRSSGTIVSAIISLGYDVPNDKVEKLLIKAALSAELMEPFVQIVDLGDFSVSYRIAGFLSEVKQILTARSKLRKMMLNTLHKAGVEIVSPSYMTQRVMKDGVSVIPQEKPRKPSSLVNDQVPEELIFDKAEEAEKLEQLRRDYDAVEKELEAIDSDLKHADESEITALKYEKKQKKIRLSDIKNMLETFEHHKD